LQCSAHHAVRFRTITARSIHEFSNSLEPGERVGHAL
jgi:hypothetical protein